jgi:biotin carboxyl carrier protein
MPTFDVTIQSKTYHVEIPDPGASPLQVIVDGESFEVGIVGTEVTARPLPAVEAPKPALQPTPLPPLPRLNVARPVVPAGAEGGGEVVAPMPGTILSVSVKPGQAIDAGAVVCVLEAMKMKNPIRASHGGTVAEIAVLPGQTVAFGDLLVKME